MILPSGNWILENLGPAKTYAVESLVCNLTNNISFTVVRLALFTLFFCRSFFHPLGIFMLFLLQGMVFLLDIDSGHAH